MTGWVMLGLEAAGRNPLDVSSGGNTPVDFLRAHVGELSSPGDLARTILALEGAGVDPRSFGGRNLVSRAARQAPRDNGSYEGWPGLDRLRGHRPARRRRHRRPRPVALLAAPRSRTTTAAGATSRLAEHRRRHRRGDAGARPTRRRPSSGLSYLRQAQRPGGGFPLGGNGAVNSQSTAWAIQGILAAGGDPGSFRRGGNSAPDYLAAQPGERRPLPLLQVQRPDPGLGDRPGPGRGGRRLLPRPPPAARTQAVKSQRRDRRRRPRRHELRRPPPPPAAVPPAPRRLARLPSRLPGTGAADPVPNVSRPTGRRHSGAQPERPLPRGERAGGVRDRCPNRSRRSRPTRLSSSTAGAIVLGLLGGRLLFAAGLGARRLWMRQRYGL